MNTPRNFNINPDDPKWTAYVLGELDEAERGEIERLIETSEEARALVEELSLATASLKEELVSRTPLMMSPEQRAAIRTAAEPKPRRWLEIFPSKWGLGLATAAAAMFVLAVALPMMRKSSVDNPLTDEAVTQTAQHQENEQAAASVTSESRTNREVTSPAGTALQPSLEKKAEATATPRVAAPVLTIREFAELAQGGAAAPPQNPVPASAAAGRTGAVLGVVQDSSGAFIPGVTVTATNTGTGTVTTQVTNASGAYTLPSLQPGTYQVSAALPGFQTRTVKDLQVKSDDAARVNFPLEVAALAQTAEVSIEADSLLRTSSASVGQVLTDKKVADLPLIGNNVLDLINVMPGVAGTPPPPAPAPPTAASSPQKTQAPAGAGARGGGGGGRGGARAEQGSQQAANVTRDGITAQGLQSTVVNPDLVGEIRLQLAPVDAELGRANGRVTAAAPPPPPPAAAPAPVNKLSVPVPNTESYDRVEDNPFIRTTQQNLATFSIDVDTASYANVRRFLNQNQLPPRDAVRIEELINYFNYEYAQPTGSAPIAPNMEVAASPWSPNNRLVRIGIKAREVNANRRPPSNLVFLIDVSGSMNSPERLPLVKAGLNMLVERLGENDSVSIVVYAGNSGLVLRPTSGLQKETIRQAIDSLQPGGSTNGASGIQLAYNQATINFLRGGVNRVILMTDGDFNVGVTSQGELTRLIEQKAKSGVFLSVLGFGMGNIKDSTLEKLADQGNGNYAYIDSLAEARKVLVEEMSGTLVTVAKDVKIQVDFNPARVEAYRLIGYENRVLRTEDFNNDAKDAGDMGAGHTVTALFEVVPKGGEVPGPSIDPSKYTQPAVDAARSNVGASSNEMLTLRVRYKLPDSDTSTRMDVTLVDRATTFNRATPDFRFAAAVAEFGMILRNSPYRGNANIESVLDIAGGSRGQDRNGYRQEFVSLVQKARSLAR